MDRHINIFGKCVALKNQRPFIVMLKWAAVTNFVSAIIVLMITFSSQTELNFGITVSIIYASVGLLFEIFWDNEMSFVRSNQTHIGKTKKIPTRVYDLGLSKNIQQVFDDGFFSYYIPSRSERTGFEWIYEKNDD